MGATPVSGGTVCEAPNSTVFTARNRTNSRNPAPFVAPTHSADVSCTPKKSDAHERGHGGIEHEKNSRW